MMIYSVVLRQIPSSGAVKNVGWKHSQEKAKFMTITKVFLKLGGFSLYSRPSFSIYIQLYRCNCMKPVCKVSWSCAPHGATCPLLTNLHEYEVSSSLLSFTLLSMLLDIMIVLTFSSCCPVSYPRNITIFPSLTNTLDLLQIYMVVLSECTLLSSEEMLHKRKCDLAHRGAFLQCVVYTYWCIHFMEKQQEFH